MLNIAVAVFGVTAIALTILAGLGWRRSGRAKTGLLALGFAFFAAAGLLAAWWLFNREDLGTLLTVHVLVTSAGLLTIYIATVKR